MECPRCEGSGVCSECSGSGHISCVSCDGKGERTTPRGLKFQCKTCAGEGTVECRPDCASCEGSGEITEELQKRVRDTYTVRFVNTTPLKRATTWILAINVAVFLLQGMPVGDFTLGEQALLATSDMFQEWKLWLLITPVFTHYAIWHLALNMWFLWAYAPALEGVLGTWRFVRFYLYCGAVAEAVSWLGLCYFGENYFAGTGASGALFGVAAAFIALHQKHGLFRSDEIRRWSFFVVGYLLFGFLGEAVGFLGFIDNYAHLGGFLAGFLWIYFGPRQIER